MKKIILAPDSYKGSLSARDVCDVLYAVIKQNFPQCEVLKMPISDGGEGFVDSMISACWGEKKSLVVSDPLNRPVNAAYGILNNGKVVIEMAAASGLPLIDRRHRDVMQSTSKGTGQLIQDALKSGCREFVFGIGGSATNDGGAGAASALGIKFLTKSGKEILCGGDLHLLDHIDTSKIQKNLLDSKITIACDVTNPLYGKLGAARIFAPQKGATPDQVELLDAGLQRLGEILLRETGVDLQKIPGSGAAGGFAAPFIAYAGASLRKGIDLVLEVMNFDEKVIGSDMVITGEGSTDRQSAMGKVVSGIGTRATKHQIPVVVISGSLQNGYEELYNFGINAFFSTTRNITSIEKAMESARESLYQAGNDLCRFIRVVEK